MELGTITDIKKFDNGSKVSFENSEYSDEFGDVTDSHDTGSVDNKLSDLIDRLNDIRNEIDDILSHFNVNDDEFAVYDEFDDYSEPDFDIDSELDYESEFYSQFDDESTEFEDEPFSDTNDNGEFDDEFDNEFGNEFENDFGQPEDETDIQADPSEKDANFQGNIRTVAGANLVYKRRHEDGNFEELWIYNVGDDIAKESKLRRAILAGTDIPSNSTESDDGNQQSSTDTVGNVQFLHITGLPN